MSQNLAVSFADIILAYFTLLDNCCPQMKIYIYALYDPVEPERVRYVGATSQYEHRMRQHVKGRDNITRPLFDELTKHGRPICHRILEVTDDLNKASAEARWTCSFSELDLLNRRVADVGFDFRISPIISLADMQLKYVTWTLEHFKGNKLATSRALGIGRQTLYNILRRMES